jgi:glycosyltransferase involved in cell wall biosynthesis
MSEVKISVVVPVYDEEPNLPELRSRLDGVLPTLGMSYEVILVDDGSSDRSFAVMREMALEDSHYTAIQLRRNYGQTAAVACGIRHSRGEVIIPMDADLQNDPADIPRLLEALDQGWDVVSGWRKDRHDAFITRSLPSMIANGLISRLTGVPLHDYGCTLKAYRREVIQDASMYGEMHRFMPALARWYGAMVTEIPVTHHPRTRGKSKYGIMRTFKVLLDLLTVKFLDSYLAKPIYVFGGFGIFCLFLGLMSFGYLTYDKIANGAYFIQSPLLILSALLGTLGVMSVLSGLLAEIMVRTYFESQGKAPYSVRETVNIEAAYRQEQESRSGVI